MTTSCVAAQYQQTPASEDRALHIVDDHAAIVRYRGQELEKLGHTFFLTE